MVAGTKMGIDPKWIPATRLRKASWECPNEGVHERVNFDDTIWGFHLAGGAHYNTPLRVTSVKDDCRAQKAGIRPGDKLLKINDVPTETLTLQEAHDIIIESGIHLRLSVTAPEDTETTYGCWEDQPEPVEPVVIPEEPKIVKYFVCKTNTNLDLQWPWVSQQKRIYKESNCYLVNSKFESKFGHKLLPIPEYKPITLQPVKLSHSTIQEVEDGKTI